MSKTFASLNPNALGPGLALDLGNLVVTTNDINLDIQRKVLGTIPKAVGHAYVECYFYSTSQGDLTGLCSFGLAASDCPLDTYVGQDEFSFGYRPDIGGIWNDGSEIDSGSSQPIPERRCIGMYVNFDSPTSAGPFVAWYVEGSQVGAVFLPSGKFWCVAVSVGSTDVGAGDLSAFVNFGQRAFENQPNQVVT